MTLLIGCVSFFVGNAYQAQMPQFTLSLIPRDNGFYYSILLIASGIGAMSAGIILETKNMCAEKFICILPGIFMVSGNYCFCNFKKYLCFDNYIIYHGVFRTDI